MNRFNLSLLAFLMGVSLASSQTLDWNGQISATGLFSSEDELPFWFYSNTHGQFGLESNFSGLAGFTVNYPLNENSGLEGGATFFYRDNVADQFQRRDLFLRFKNNWLKLTLGAERPEEQVQGLSATNKDFLRSGNARPLGGIIAEANNPLRITESLAFDWGIAHYQLNDDRFVKDVRLHYKRLAAILNFNENNKLIAQIQHYAQWAGTSPVFGELPSDFSAFIDVFFARQSPEIGINGEIENAVGNHLGSYLIDYQFKSGIGDFSIYHEHPFEDGSGTAFKNFPDGVWGVHFKPTETNVFKGLLYEFITTKDQSASGVSGFDNYFRNNVYRSGWSYEGRIIGMPFILIDNSIVVDEDSSPIISNREQLHHLGLTGTVHHIDWMLKSTLVSHSGSFVNPFNPSLDLWHNYLSLAHATKKYGTIKIFTALDSGKSIDTNFGAGVTYSYSF
ncbi:MAG: hypothetical protein HKO54_04185 [Flavobacteriaceae bacterium]|nr:hypothetical protein [Flavobacteriaceae bacterium]